MSHKFTPPEQVIKEAAEWAGVSEMFLMSRVVDNPNRTGFTALYEMTRRALAAEQRVQQAEAEARNLREALEEIKEHCRVLSAGSVLLIERVVLAALLGREKP